MPFTSILLGGQTRRVHTEAENAVHRGSSMPVSQDVHAAIDRAQEVGPGAVGQIGDKVTAVVTTFRETIPELVLEETRSVSAFIADVVPIPWLHGEQPMRNLDAPHYLGPPTTAAWAENA